MSSLNANIRIIMYKQTILNWLILITLSFIWGSSFILMKRGLEGFTYIEVGFFRLIVAFFVLIPFLKSSLKNIKKYHVIPLLIVSIIGTVIPAVLFAFSQTYLNSASAGMLSALTPMFTFIIGIVLFHVKWEKMHIIGVLIGFIGSYILLLPSSINIIKTKYSLVILLATICYALSINTIKSKLFALSALDIAVLSSFFSFLIPFLYLINSEPIGILNNIYVNINAFSYIMILGIVCTSGAIILFNYLIRSTSALFGSSTTYLIPIFAVSWGLIDGELIKNHEIVGILIILLGVFIMNYRR